jgi:flagellar hook protein FlgE
MLRSIQHSLVGVQRNQQSFERAADRISRWGTTDPGAPEGIDLAAEIVQLMEARFGYSANLQVIKAADEMLGTAIDTVA